MKILKFDFYRTSMNKKVKSKIFLGPSNTANVSSSFESAFELIGIKADFYTYTEKQHPFSYNAGRQLFLFEKNKLFAANKLTRFSFYKINSLLKVFYVLWISIKYNTLIFIYPDSLLPDNRDLKIYRFFNRKIIGVFVGCPDRDIYFDKSKNYICNICSDTLKQELLYCDRIQDKKKRIQFFETYVDYVIGQPDSTSYIKNKKIIWAFLTCNPPNNDRFLRKLESPIINIVHFPSNPLIKGSNIIIPILDRIGKLDNVNIIIKTKIPHAEVMEELEKSHILVDELHSLSYGVLSIEAMSRGCIVFSSYKSSKDINEPISPVIKIDTDKLYEDLLSLISNRKKMATIASDSIEHYSKFHMPEVIANYYRKSLDL